LTPAATTSIRSETVLCYHAVSPTWEHRLSLSLDLLLRQVRAVRRLGPVHVTFDDAFRSIEPALDAVLAEGLPVTIFACSGFADEGGAPLAIPELDGDDPVELATMTWDDLRRAKQRGVRVQAHSVSHPHLTTLSEEELERELTESKRRIEEELGGGCVDFAYPYGERDDRVRAAVRAAGYERAFALGAKPGDPYDIPRVDLYRRHGVTRTLLRAIAR
jgi:peptidoglycan/xylan/chitin deacetylase (PgdA/CDA1 family)